MCLNLGFLFMRKSHETKTLPENLKETFTICFRARLKKGWVVWDPSCFFGESYPPWNLVSPSLFSLPWNNGYLRVRVVSSFHYRRFARVVTCLTLPLFKNGILVHSPAVPWKSASLLTAFHVRLFVFRSCIFHLWIFGQKIKSIQGSFSARRMAFDMYMYMYIYIYTYDLYIYCLDKFAWGFRGALHSAGF